MKKLLVALILVMGCDTATEPETHRVLYQVTGTATEVFVTYANAQGGTSQTEAAVPWTLTFDAPGGQFVYVSAQNQGEAGTVVSEIWIDGTRFKKSESEGQFVIATASGSVP